MSHPRSALRRFLLLMTALTAVLLAPLHAAEASSGNRPAGPRSDYVLQPGDQIQVLVFQEDELKRETRITQQYAITLPLIGEVNLRGKTVLEAKNLIRDLYAKDFLVNPQVTVNVLEYTKRFVNVIGSVNKPGAVEFPPEQGLTLLEAITRAEGFSRLADKKKVTLTRTVNGRTEKTTVNTDDILSGSEKDLVLTKDDVINVPEKLL
jgi:polysaccharide export outer membrane protein